ncbi:MAG: hypothetical protein ACOYWZ_23835 [Bacillota bacterium]
MNPQEVANKSVTPIWLQDYASGYSIFTITDNSFFSDGIIWFQNLDESVEYAELLKVKGFSHVLMAVNKHFGIEAAEKGIQFCDLQKEYFSNPHVHCVCREPQDMDELTFLKAFNYALKLKDRGYDVGAFLGMVFVILTKLSDFIPPLRKLPAPLHLPGARYCSAFVSDCYKHTQRYKNIELFKKWHVTRIHVHKLWNRFPYKPFRFDKERV